MAKRPRRKADTETQNPSTSDSSTRYTSETAGAADQAQDMGGPATIERDDARETTRSDSMGSEPSEEDIRLRAYRRYLERGAGDGQDFDDWLAAERELKQR
jgi:hypothetical protein